MKDDSDFIFKLTEETMNEEGLESFIEVESHHNIIDLDDSLFDAYPISIYDSFIRVNFKYGPQVDIPRGLELFDSEENLYSIGESNEVFKLTINDKIFKEVLSAHLFVNIDKAIVFKQDESLFIIFYDSKFEEKVCTEVDYLVKSKNLRAA